MKIGNCIIVGPGHNPPIPQPSPKHAAPKTNFQSIKVIWGLNNFYPKIGLFFTLIK